MFLCWIKSINSTILLQAYNFNEISLLIFTAIFGGAILRNGVEFCPEYMDREYISDRYFRPYSDQNPTGKELDINR